MEQVFFIVGVTSLFVGVALPCFIMMWALAIQVWKGKR